MELKPCPFCGAKANMWSWNGGTRIDCSNWCSTHCVGVEGKTVEEAIKAWNRRAAEGGMSMRLIDADELLQLRREEDQHR